MHLKVTCFSLFLLRKRSEVVGLGRLRTSRPAFIWGNNRHLTDWGNLTHAYPFVISYAVGDKYDTFLQANDVPPAIARLPSPTRPSRRIHSRGASVPEW